MGFQKDSDFLTTLRANLMAAQGMSIDSLSKGSIVGDEYVLGDKINEGGSGVIYKCHKKNDHERVFALKVCLPKSTNAARRFQAEVTASYQVRHPNVLRSVDCFFHGKQLAYIMEYAPGGDLRDILDLEKELPIETIIILVRQLCGGLSAIHNAGIIHRDIKPENILFSTDGKLKIADFGISFTSELTRVTSNGSLVGTINYMAPEYVERGIFDPRSDLFSLGVMIYEMLTHKLPFGYSKTLDELLDKMSKGFPPVSTLRPDCPYKLSNLVSKLLALIPEERFHSASEVELEMISIEKEVLVGGIEDQDLIALQESFSKLDAYTDSKKDYFGFVVFILITVITVGVLAAVLKLYL